MYRPSIFKLVNLSKAVNYAQIYWWLYHYTLVINFHWNNQQVDGFFSKARRWLTHNSRKPRVLSTVFVVKTLTWWWQPDSGNELLSSKVPPLSWRSPALRPFLTRDCLQSLNTLTVLTIVTPWLRALTCHILILQFVVLNVSFYSVSHKPHV